MEIDIALGKNRGSLKWNNKSMEWDDLVEMCRETIVTYETMKEYGLMEKSRQDAIKDVGAYCSGLLKGGSRKKSNVQHKQVVTLDADHAKPGFWKRFKRMYGNAAFAYTTHKHTPEKPRYRLCILLDRPADPDEYEPICRRIAYNLGIEQFDPTGYDLNRLMYFPSTSKDGEYRFHEQDGEPLCVDEVLETYHDYLDVSEWPMGNTEEATIRNGIKMQGDPTEKGGVVGAWCRTYDVEDVIEMFLSDVYEPTDIEDRYSFIHGEGSHGLIIYDGGKFAYSQHSTDPASKTLCNSFDLVRIHLFANESKLYGENLDAKSNENTSAGAMPSFKAMSELAAKDKSVVKLLNSERFQDAGLDLFDFADDGDDEEALTDWLGELDTNMKTGEIQTTYKNIQLILENDPNLRKKFGLNEFAEQVEVLDKLPWAKKKRCPRQWSDDDDAGLNVYLGSAPYELKRTPMVEDVLAVIKHKNSFHPIKDWIESEEWDGVERAESLFIDYLGAEDDEYTRTVSRKALVACVARIYEPGCKFEYLLTLVGEEGRGKSTILKKLGRKTWYTNTFSFSMLQGGNGVRAYEQLNNKWIVETGEMTGLRAADDTAVKNFISGEVDSYRGSHQKHTQDRPRQSVMFGSSNPDDFLKSKHGNRRFWPVTIAIYDPEKDVWEDLTEAEVQQVWAECLVLYRAGEELFLSNKMEKVAKAVQEAHMERDERQASIERFLDMLLPEDWPDMGSRERQLYFELGDEERPGIIQRKIVSAAEIWVECFGGTRKDMTTRNAAFIHDIMRAHKLWSPMKSKTDIKFYGTQRAYSRIKLPNRGNTAGKLPIEKDDWQRGTN